MKLQTIMATLVGLLLGVFYSFGGLIIDGAVTLELITSNETTGLGMGTLLAFGALIGMPLICAAAGALLAFFEVLLYNLFVKYFPIGQLNIYRD